MQRQPGALVFEEEPVVACDESLEASADVCQLLDRDRRHVQLASRVPPFAAVQTREREPQVVEQPVEIREGPAADQGHGPARGRAQLREELPERRIHETAPG